MRPFNLVLFQSDFWVSKWNSRHCYHAICLLALYLRQSQKFDCQGQAPLKGVSNVTIMIAAQIAARVIPEDSIPQEWENTTRRYRQQQRDINRHYRAP